MNPFFQAMGANRQGGSQMNIMQQFQQFRQSFKGDPREEVQRLLQSGKITQAQLDQAQAMAQQFQMFLR